MNKEHGFTIVELILVIVIIGILAAVVGPRFFTRGNFDERFYFEEVLSTVRYAQKLAVASGCLVKVTVDSGGYKLEYGEGACLGAVIEDPSGKPYPIAPSKNVVVHGAIDYAFNSLGCVSDTATCPAQGIDELEIGESRFKIKIHRATGFIEVSP
ncbi:MAG: prepilin-type N-terminal cleavage/methylation domain-containing protein [Pseudomonas stutzeri]|nr:prepilin-type N-terminal cleavage/methylation domain-containing protein [Stutzerimonas stutzeri]